ncbi:MAG: putative glutamine amidotransferase [Solirubrobacteraceae bacterium]|jgi:putative glutamine amidotransferase|nr:putative glutamine amidotransferase [Solirubrobacteraceae bacterium]
MGPVLTSARGRGGRPLIGISTSEERAPPDTVTVRHGEPPRVEIVLGMTYVEAIERAGGLPVVLPPIRLSDVDGLLDGIAGVCISGGPDLHPSAYGRESHRQLGPTWPHLDVFELALARRARNRRMPILGVCRGAQVLNVALGGTLHQHVSEIVGEDIRHRQEEPGATPTHNVEIAPDSLLARLMGSTACEVNSFHHQAVDRLGAGLQAVAWAPDGIVEGVELASSRQFVVGVQWHAEGLVSRSEHARLFERFVHAAAAHDREARRRQRAA